MQLLDVHTRTVSFGTKLSLGAEGTMADSHERVLVIIFNHAFRYLNDTEGCISKATVS